MINDLLVKTQIYKAYYAYCKGRLVAKDIVTKLDMSNTERSRLTNFYMMINTYPRIILCGLPISYMKAYAKKICNLLSENIDLVEKMREDIDIYNHDGTAHVTLSSAYDDDDS